MTAKVRDETDRAGLMVTITPGQAEAIRAAEEVLRKMEGGDPKAWSRHRTQLSLLLLKMEEIGVPDDGQVLRIEEMRPLRVLRVIPSGSRTVHVIIGNSNRTACGMALVDFRASTFPITCESCLSQDPVTKIAEENRRQFRGAKPRR